MQDSSEQTTKNNEATPEAQHNGDEEFFEDVNVDFEGDFEEGSELRFSPGGGFRYVLFLFISTYFIKRVNELYCI